MTTLQTDLLKLGRNSKKYQGMVNPPIYRTTTKIYEKIEELWQDEVPIHTSIAYGRCGTPTVKELEKAASELDQVNNAIATTTGMSAIAICFHSFLKSGDHLLISDAVYKCTRRFVDEELVKNGITATYYEPAIGGEIAELITPQTKMIYMESPGSGTMEIQDVPLLTSIAKKHGIITVLDNSWATPVFFKPFQHGVDIAIQSMTKYISGHSDNFLGIICAIDAVFKPLYATAINYGAAPSPDSCYMALRGLRTLYVRLKQHEASAIKLANWLKTNPEVISVMHPALPDSNGHTIWKRDFTGSSGLFSFAVNANEEKIKLFMNDLKIFSIGLSWGGFESLLIPYKLQGLRNLTKNLLNDAYYFRIHVGLEDPEDLIDDLRKAFIYFK